MQSVSKGEVAECFHPLLDAIEHQYGSGTVLKFVVTRCGDQRHKNRSVMDITREKFAEELVGTEVVAQAKACQELKDFNLDLAKVLQTYDTSPAGGRYSRDAIGYFGIIHRAGARLDRLYLGDHETSKCQAAADGFRMSWESAIESNFRDLRQVGIDNEVKIFAFNVVTDGTQVSNVHQIGLYRGVRSKPEVYCIPEDF